MKKTIGRMAIMALMSALLFNSCSKEAEYEEITYTQEKEKQLLTEYLSFLQEKEFDIDTTANGVYYVVLEEGTGETPKQGETVKVAYTGKFIGGIAFDSSGDPATNGYFTFKHKIDRMIPGWEEGLSTMRKGGKSLLIVPSPMAYGSNGNFGIPPFSTLLFEIYLHDIIPPVQP